MEIKLPGEAAVTDFLAERITAYFQQKQAEAEALNQQRGFVTFGNRTIAIPTKAVPQVPSVSLNFPNIAVRSASPLGVSTVGAFKIDIFFKSGDSGWSETWYDQAPSFQTAFNDAQTLASGRCKLLASDADIINTRVSDVTIIGDSEVSPGNTNLKFVPATIGDPPFVAAECRGEGTQLYRRAFHIQGIPAGVAKPTTVAQTTLSNQWKLALAQFLGTVVTNSTSTRGPAMRVHLRGSDNLAKNIAKFTVTATGYDVTFVTGVPVGIVPGDQLQIYNIREFPTLAGRWFVSAVAGLVVSIVYPNPVNFTFKGKAYGRRVVLSYVPFTNIFFEKFDRGRVGRPFGVPVGRRKRRPLPVI